MHRKDLKAKLQAAGIEDENVLKDLLDGIMNANGEDVETARNAGADERQSEVDALKQSLKKYEQGGEKYIDAAEFERLKKFETDTKAQAERAKKEGALSAFLETEKVGKGYHKIIMKSADLSTVSVDEKGGLSDESAKTLRAFIKENCPDAYEAVAAGAGNPAGVGLGGASVGGNGNVKPDYSTDLMAGIAEGLKSK